MDNWYSSPFLFYNLWLVQTGACGTSCYRKGYPTDLFKTKLKKQGDKIVISGNNIHAIRIYDHKPVCLILTVYDTNPIWSGKIHWKTKEPIMKPSLMCSYNKCMGGVDSNDQLLQYSAYNRRSLKWWKKVALMLLNLSMTNAYILYNYWRKLRNCKEITHTKFCITVIKKLIASTVPPQQVQSVPSVTEFACLTGRHFPELIPCNGKQVVRRCQVCNPAERQMDKSAGKLPRKRPGRESSHQCDICKINLCISLCLAYKKKFHSKIHWFEETMFQYFIYWFCLHVEFLISWHGKSMQVTQYDQHDIIYLCYFSYSPFVIVILTWTSIF